MSDATVFTVTDIPPDSLDSTTGDFDPEFPGSTPDAPYGFFTEGPNAGQPRKRRPKGSGKGTSTVGKMPATDRQAETAASLLARLNSLVGVCLTFAGMPMSAMELEKNNDQFRAMAKEALLADPQLCKKILSTGATGGKTGLAMAYLMLGVQTFPSMKAEYRENHPKEIDNETEGNTYE